MGTPVARNCRSLSVAETVRSIPTRLSSCSIVLCSRSTARSGRSISPSQSSLRRPPKLPPSCSALTRSGSRLRTAGISGSRRASAGAFPAASPAGHRAGPRQHSRRAVDLRLARPPAGAGANPARPRRCAGLMIGSWSPAGMGIAWSSRPMRSAASIGSRCRNSRNRRRPWRNRTPVTLRACSRGQAEPSACSMPIVCSRPSIGVSREEDQTGRREQSADAGALPRGSGAANGHADQRSA